MILRADAVEAAVRGLMLIGIEGQAAARVINALGLLLATSAARERASDMTRCALATAAQSV